MKNIVEKFIRNHLLMFIAIFVFAVFFYLYKLGFSDLWSDEVYTKSMLNGTLSEFFSRFKNDLHPPLYYFGLRLFTSLFGLSPLTLRLFSVLGVLSTLLLGYFAGQRVFGKQGAIYFCLMLISVPMLATYSHQARMYTWAAFSVTGVFLYAYIFIKSGRKSDLSLLFLFTVAAMYIHYYSLAAAFMANMFVFLNLLLTRNKNFFHHLLSMLVAAIIFLPWLFMFVVQIKKVQHAFWAPEVNFSTVLACFTIPFTEQFWVSGTSRIMIILVYSLIALAIAVSFTKRAAEIRAALWLSIFIFVGTLVLVAVISLFTQPILFSRYVMAIVTMLAVPLTVLLITLKLRWLKLTIMSVFIVLGIRVSLSSFWFSYGPYQQTVEYISSAYPEIHKILHITEITACPLIEYNGNSGLSHYWLKAEMSNVDAFPEIQQFNRPGDFLRSGEEFCVVRFSNLELNIENLELVLSESELIKTDTVRDKKVEDGIFMQLYLLKYIGRKVSESY